MTRRPYDELVEHYERCLEKHGDTFRGVDYTKEHEVDVHYKVMLELVRSGATRDTTLLDFGCGASHMYEYMLRTGALEITYAGLDLSPKFVELSQSKFPSIPYYCLDVLSDAEKLPQFDYIVMTGVLTEKRQLSFDDMWEYAQRLLQAVFRKARIGIAFNTMSKQVDWERDDLFHLPIDTLAWFLKKNLTRHFVIRSDYGLYEYTTYVYHAPVR